MKGQSSPNTESMDTATESQENVCLMHFSTVENDNYQSFSETSWNKFTECVTFWKNFDTEHGEIANKLFITRPELLRPRLGNASDIDDIFVLDPPSFPNGYHRQCYQKFTNVSRIERFKKKLQSTKIQGQF